MMFRILTVSFVILLGMYFLTDSQRFSGKKRIDRFDDQIVLELLYKRRKALAHFDLETFKDMYSRHIITELITPGGDIYRGDYKEVIELINDFGRTGTGYEKTLLNYAVLVADDGQSAVVRKEALESWIFEDEFNSVSGNLIETQRWVLENGIPKIAGIRKEQSISNPFLLQRREIQGGADAGSG